MDDAQKNIDRLLESHAGAEREGDVFSMVYDAIESANAGIVITDNNGFITYANTSFLKMFGYFRKSDIIKTNATDIFVSGEIVKFSDIQAVIDATKGSTEDFIVTRKDGTKFFAEVSSSSVTNLEGRIVGRMSSFIDITERKRIEQERETLIKKLQDALAKIKKLSGMLPICASCKKIRDYDGYWNQIEVYIEHHSDALFSHGLCPDCMDKIYGDEDWYKRKKMDPHVMVDEQIE